MSRRGYLFAAGLAAAVFIMVLAPSEKKKIKKVIRTCTEAVVHEDIDQLMKAISFNYRDGRGGSYLQVKKRAELIFNRFDDFHIQADVMEIRLREELAEADLKVSIVASEGTDRGYIIGDAVGAQDMMVILEKSPYAWKIVNFVRSFEGPP